MLQDIQKDIDETLDLLMQNASAIKCAKASHAFDHELKQLEHLQESLLARLLNRQALLDEQKIQSIPKATIEKKVLEYSKPQKSASRRKARSKSSG